MGISPAFVLGPPFWGGVDLLLRQPTETYEPHFWGCFSMPRCDSWGGREPVGVERPFLGDLTGCLLLSACQGGVGAVAPPIGGSCSGVLIGGLCGV